MGDSIVALSPFGSQPIFQHAVSGWNSPGVGSTLQAYSWGPMLAERWPVVGDEAYNYHCDCAATGGVALVCWQVWNTIYRWDCQVVCCAFDTVKNVVIQTAVYEHASMPRVEAVGDHLALTFATYNDDETGNSLRVRLWDTTHNELGFSQQLVLSEETAKEFYERLDICEAPTGWAKAGSGSRALFVAAATDDVTRVWNVDLTRDGGTLAPTESSAASVNKECSLAIGCIRNYSKDAAYMGLITADATDGLTTKWFAAVGITTGITHTLTQAIDALRKKEIWNVTGSALTAFDLTNGADHFVLWEERPVLSGPSETDLWDIKTMFAGVYRKTVNIPYDDEPFVRSCGIRSKVFCARGSDGMWSTPFFVWLAYPRGTRTYQSTMLQPTNFLYPINVVLENDSIYSPVEES